MSNETKYVLGSCMMAAVAAVLLVVLVCGRWMWERSIRPPACPCHGACCRPGGE